jgi:hypothetical protein
MRARGSSPTMRATSRASWAFLLLSLSVLAGCADERAEPLAPAPPALPPLAPIFDRPVAMPQAAGAGEPNIAVLPDGTLFVAAPVGGTAKPNAGEGAAYLWRSTDDGKTWTVVRSPHIGPSDQLPQPGGAFCSCDADVTTSPDGWVYYSDWWIAGVAPGNYLVEASGDSGETWTTTPVTIPQDLAASVDRQWLVAGEGGFLGLFYSFYSPSPAGTLPVPAAGLDRPGQAILAAFSTDHGQTFGDPVAVVPADAGVSYQIAHPFLAPNGTLMMPYGRVPDSDHSYWLSPSEVRLAWSTDKGMTWTDSPLATAPVGFDNLWAVQGAVDVSTGEATVVWASRLDGVKGDDVADTSRMALQVLQFGPLGTIGPVVVRGNGTNFLPWAAARDGATAVGWYGGEATGDVTEAPSDSSWYAYVARAPGGLFTAGNFSVSQVAAEPVKVGPICPKGAACGGDRELLDYVSLVFDDGGLLHYAYASSRLDEGALGGKNAYVHVVNQAA